MDADRYYSHEVGKWGQGDKPGAIVGFDEAIRFMTAFALGDVKSAVFARFNGDIDEDIISLGMARLTSAWPKLAQGNYLGAMADMVEANCLVLITQYTRNRAKLVQGDDPGLIAVLDKEISLNKADADMYLSRGLVKFSQGDYPGAIADLDRFVQLNKDGVGEDVGYFFRGMAKGFWSNYPGAVADFDRVIHLNNGGAKVIGYFGRSVAKFLQDDKPGAIADFEEFIRLNKDDAMAHAGRSVVKLMQGDYPGAIADFGVLIHLQPDNVLTYTLRAKAFEKLDRHAEAQEDRRQIIVIQHRNNPQTPLYEAISSGQHETALSFLRIIHERAPNKTPMTITPQGEEPALLTLARFGHTAWLPEFLKYNAIDVTDKQGNGAFHIAARHGHFEFYEALLTEKRRKNGADKRYDQLVNNAGETPLHSMASFPIQITEEATEKLFQLFVKAKVDINAQTKSKKETALHQAMQRNNLALVKLLVKEPTINIYLADSEGQLSLDVPSNEALQRYLKTLVHSDLIMPTVWPRDVDYAIFSEHVYNADIMPGDGVGFLRKSENDYIELPDWRVYRVFHASNGYFSALYVNPKMHQFLLAHRGTEGSKWDALLNRDDIRADIEGIVRGIYTDQMVSVLEATKEAVSIAREYCYKLSSTGHSLGGWEAAYSVIYAHQKLKYSLRAVLFDTPSLEKMRQLTENAQGIDFNKFDITVYLSAPNAVNTLGKLSKGVKYFRVFTADCNPSVYADAWFLKTLRCATSLHSISYLVDALRSENPNRLGVVEKWPSIDHHGLSSGIELAYAFMKHYAGLGLGGVIAWGLGICLPGLRQPDQRRFVIPVGSAVMQYAWSALGLRKLLDVLDPVVTAVLYNLGNHKEVEAFYRISSRYSDPTRVFHFDEETVINKYDKEESKRGNAKKNAQQRDALRKDMLVASYHVEHTVPMVILQQADILNILKLLRDNSLANESNFWPYVKLLEKLAREEGMTQLSVEALLKKAKEFQLLLAEHILQNNRQQEVHLLEDLQSLVKNRLHLLSNSPYPQCLVDDLGPHIEENKKQLQEAKEQAEPFPSLRRKQPGVTSSGSRITVPFPRLGKVFEYMGGKIRLVYSIFKSHGLTSSSEPLGADPRLLRESSPAFTGETSAHAIPESKEQNNSQSGGGQPTSSYSSFLQPLSGNDYLGVVVPYVSHYARQYSPFTFSWNKVRTLTVEEGVQLKHYQTTLPKLREKLLSQQESTAAKSGLFSDKLRAAQQHLVFLEASIPVALKSEKITTTAYHEIKDRFQHLETIIKQISKANHELRQVNKNIRTQMNREMQRKGELGAEKQGVQIKHDVVSGKLAYKFLNSEEATNVSLSGLPTDPTLRQPQSYPLSFWNTQQLPAPGGKQLTAHSDLNEGGRESKGMKR
jgi:tetratricopeptide (TPR) repeat protein